MDDKLWWHVSRAGGLTAWALLAASVLWGLAVVAGPTRRLSAAWTLDLHRFLGSCALMFTTLHVAVLTLDREVRFGLRDIAVPFASSWRPSAVGWGVIGLYLLLAVQLTSWLRPRIPKRLWRSVHWLTYPLLGLSSWHAFTAGTDTAGRGVRWTAVGVGALLSFLVVYRALARSAPVAPAADLRLLVRQTRWEADRVMSFLLADPAGRELPSWEPGAHVELVLPSGLTRQYSLCGNPAVRDEYRIAVLSASEGRGGAREIHETVRAGGTIGVRGPRNRFPLVDAPAYLFVAGGIGITPMLAMARAVAAGDRPWRLYYTGRERSGMAFVDEVLALDGDRVCVHPGAELGRLDVAEAVAKAGQDAAVYCCGPEALVQAVVDAVGEPERVHVERFAAPSRGGAVAGGEPFSVSLARSGAVLPVPADRSLLDVLRDAGCPVASSCGEGICGTCEVRVLAGVPDHRDEVLTDAEKERGDVMMVCVSRAAGDRLTLDL